MARPKDMDASAVEAEIARIQTLSKYELIILWRKTMRSEPPPAFTKDLIGRYLAYRVQEQAFGGLDRETKNFLDALARGRAAGTPRPRRLKPGTVIVREYQGERHTVTVAADGFIWREKTYPSLSMIAREVTGTGWNGPRFFGVRIAQADKDESEVVANAAPATVPKMGRRPGVRHRRSRIGLEDRL
jgi:hypothetical protein